MISFRNVSKYYGKTAAIRDVTFEIAKQEFVYLVGASGAGKTTVLRLLHHDLFPSEGTIHIGDFQSDRIRTSQISKLRRKLGFVHQDTRLIGDRSVFDNIAIAMRVAGARRGAIRKRVKEVLSDVGLLGRIGEKAENLSGGELQRVAIARAMANRPLVMIADEPTGNLDPDTAAEIYDILDRANLAGTAIFVATHDWATVRASSHRVLRLENGLVFQGAPKSFPKTGS